MAVQRKWFTKNRKLLRSTNKATPNISLCRQSSVEILRGFSFYSTGATALAFPKLMEQLTVHKVTAKQTR
jgi:hypothetical protein